MKGTLTLALLAVLAGCVAPSGLMTQSAVPVTKTLPAELVDPTFLRPVLLGTDELGAEPNVAIAPDGTVYVSTPHGMWRSDDGGRTYMGLGKPDCLALPCTAPNPGTQGGGDGSIVVDVDGTVHWAGLGGRNTSVPYQQSTDKGDSWSKPRDVAEPDNTTDREWISKDRIGGLHVVWRDLGNVSEDCIYIPTRDTCYVDPRSNRPQTIQWAHTKDGGFTWTRSPIGADGISGPLVADPTSDALYVPVVRDGVRVMRSLDGGATWDEVVAQPAVPFFATQIFPVAAVDDAGDLYLVWSHDPSNPLNAASAAGPYGTVTVARATARPSVFLSVSHDHGATFSKPLMLSPPGIPALLPWIDAGAPGRIAVAWYEAAAPVPSDRAPNLWNVRLAMSTNADVADPTIKVWTVTPTPNHVGSLCTAGLVCSLTGGDRSLLDFFEIRIHPDGSPVIAYAADDTVKMGLTRVFATRMETGTPLR